jgi:hypothetical protein
LILLVLSVGACDRRRSGHVPAGEYDASAAFLDHSQLQPIHVSGRALGAHGGYGSPWKVFVTSDTTLLVLDDYPPFVHLVQRSDGALLESFGKPGQGPGEFTSADAFLPDYHLRHKIWIHDHIRRRLHRFDLRNPGAGADSVVRLDLVAPLESPVWLSDSTVAGLARHDSAGVAVLNIVSGARETRGSGLRLSTVDIETLRQPGRRRLAGDFRGCHEPTRSTFVRMHRHGAIVDFIKASDGTATRAKSPFNYEPLLIRDIDIGWELNYDTGVADQRVSYQSCSTTEDFVLALFSGRRAGSHSTADKYLCSYIHVFAWSGALLGVLELNEPLHGLSIDAVTLELFGVRRHPVPAVFRYELAPVLAALKP